MKCRLNTIFLILVSFLLASCATVLNTTTQDVEIKSNPANAKIFVDGKKFGTTPQVINIDRGSDHSLKLELDGHDAYETQVTRKISFWFWANALNGFIPGMITDMFTGSMYNLLPEKINVDLTPSKPPEKTGKK
ncbi:MAG: PEGA domain-containing protein [Melioribacteraceae bacterium]|nr:PEGA domain-containing protein [Melioribacteraceae bacterium]